MEHLTIESLQNLLQSEEEGTQLEYKGSEKLRKDQAVAICKTVSAFANSNGGRLIFGIDANSEPKKLDDGINPTEWKQQIGQEPELWIRQMLASKIQRNIVPPDIYFLDHPTNSGSKLIVIDVLQSQNAPHQLKEESDKFSYWYRNGSQNKQMEDWQIRDVMNRGSGPCLDLVCSMSKPNEGERWHSTDVYSQRTFWLQMPIVNLSDNPAEYLVLTLYIDNRLKLYRFFDHRKPKIDRNNPVTLSNGCQAVKHVFDLKPEIPVFGDEPYHWIWSPQNSQDIQISFRDDNFKNNSVKDYVIRWELRSHRMRPRYGIEVISYRQEEDHLYFKTEKKGVIGDE